jgi:CRISPR-associated endonuclease/helicase Cas3
MPAFNQYLQQVRDAWKPKDARPFIDQALEKIAQHWDTKNIFVIEAPTGYGKSTISAVISLYSAKEGIKSILAYPLRTLIEDQYNLFVGRKEGKAPIYEVEFVGKRYMSTFDSRYLVKPITLTTIDTLALTLFGIPPEDFEKAFKAYKGIFSSFGHYLFSWASVILSNVVLDEVHLVADSTKSLSFLIALIKLAIRFDQKLILMSATIPEVVKKVIAENIDKTDKEKIIFIEFSTACDEKFVRERENKKYDMEIQSFGESEKIESLIKILEKEQGAGKVLTVFNTVEDAIRFYERLKNHPFFKTYQILLLHSRFSEIDKERKSQILSELSKSDKYVIVSTQVIEAGVDITSDLCITEVAPASSLIQRLGRFLRYEENSGKIVIWYEKDINGELKMSISMSKEPKNLILVDTCNEEIFEKCRSILQQRYGSKEVKKLSQWNGRHGIYRGAIARPMYKVYDYELTLRTLRWLEQNKDKLRVHVPEATDGYGYRKFLNDVYGELAWVVDRENVEELLKIHYYLNEPKAMEILVKMEGSFVREGNLENAIPEEFARELEGKNVDQAMNSIRKYCVPVSRNFLHSCENKIKGILKIENGKIQRFKFGGGTERIDPQRVAFVVDAKYDPELGLSVDK